MSFTVEIVGNLNKHMKQKYLDAHFQFEIIGIIESKDIIVFYFLLEKSMCSFLLDKRIICCCALLDYFNLCNTDLYWP